MLWGDQNAVDEMINEDVIKTLCEIENGRCLQRSLDSILIDIFHVPWTRFDHEFSFFLSHTHFKLNES